MSAFRCLDLDVALQRVDGDLDLLREVAGLFLDESPKMMAGLEDALRKRDAPALARAAHAIKGCVATFCAQPAYDAARALEIAGRNEKLAEAARDVARLSSALNALTPELAALAFHLD